MLERISSMIKYGNANSEVLVDGKIKIKKKNRFADATTKKTAAEDEYETFLQKDREA